MCLKSLGRIVAIRNQRVVWESKICTYGMRLQSYFNYGVLLIKLIRYGCNSFMSMSLKTKVYGLWNLLQVVLGPEKVFSNAEVLLLLSFIIFLDAILYSCYGMIRGLIISLFCSTWIIPSSMPLNLISLLHFVVFNMMVNGT